MNQTSFRGQKNTEKSRVRLNFDASSVLHPTSARSKTRSSPEYSTSENQFSEVFPLRVFRFVLYLKPKTRVFSKVYLNNDFLLNCVTSRILIKLRVFQLRGFVFALYPKPKTRRWKTSEPFDLIITVLNVVQNGKLKVGKPRRLIKIPQSLIKIPQEKICEVFISEFSVSAIVQNGKGKPRKNILRDF